MVADVHVHHVDAAGHALGVAPGGALVVGVVVVEAHLVAVLMDDRVRVDGRVVVALLHHVVLAPEEAVGVGVVDVRGHVPVLVDGGRVVPPDVGGVGVLAGVGLGGFVDEVHPVDPAVLVIVVVGRALAGPLEVVLGGLVADFRGRLDADPIGFRDRVGRDVGVGDVPLDVEKAVGALVVVALEGLPAGLLAFAEEGRLDVRELLLGVVVALLHVLEDDGDDEHLRGAVGGELAHA